jgi:hypothetical protein
MAKSPFSRYDRWGIIFLLAILIGIGLSPSLSFKIPILGFLDISILTFGIVGIIVGRRKVIALKRSNPELFKAMEAENSATARKCAVCNAENAFLYRCYYCKKYFCEQHKLPKKHLCSMAPKIGFGAALLISILIIFIGIAMLYASLGSSLSWRLFLLFLGGWVTFFGTLLLIGRSWEERQSKHAIGLS